jgi:hypothetical protein
MVWAVSIVLLLILSFIVYEDFMYHAISWYVVPLLVIALIINGAIQLNSLTLLEFFAINFTIVTFQLLLLLLYFYMKSRSLKSIFKEKLGLGDVLMLYALGLFFAPLNFILFILASLILTLFIAIILKSIYKSKAHQIPLAGYWGIYINLLIIAKLFKPTIDYYQTNYIENFIFQLS